MPTQQRELEPAPHASAAAIDASPSPADLRSSLRYSVLDGLAWAMMHGAGERFVVPLVVLNGAGLLRVAAIAALPMLAGGIVQCISANLTDRFRNRRWLIVFASNLQALTWLVMAGAMFAPISQRYWLLLAAYVAMLALHNLCVPPWNSLMGDLVPAERRGHYFGLRNAVVGGGIILALLCGGQWLTYCSEHPTLAFAGLRGRAVGFMLLFLFACAARFVSAYYLSRMYNISYRPQPEDHFTLWQFLRRAPRAQFGRFVFYSMLIHMGLNFLAQFIPWYLLGELGHSEAAFATVMTFNLLAYWGSQPLWGRLMDRIGSKRVLSIGGIGIVLEPLLLLVSNDLWWYGAVMVYGGVVLSAFGMASAGYLFDIVTPAKRARCTAYHSLCVNIGASAGTLAGGITGTLLPHGIGLAGFAHPFVVVLIGAAILRLLPNLILLHTFHEFRLVGNRPRGTTERM